MIEELIQSTKDKSECIRYYGLLSKMRICKLHTLTQFVSDPDDPEKIIETEEIIKLVNYQDNQKQAIHYLSQFLNSDRARVAVFSMSSLMKRSIPYKIYNIPGLWNR